MLRPLGTELRRLRLDRDLSQERLAELAGCSYKYLGRIELATANATAAKLIQLARALGVPPGRLFDTTPDSDQHPRLTRKRATRRPRL